MRVCVQLGGTADPPTKILVVGDTADAQLADLIRRSQNILYYTY